MNGILLIGKKIRKNRLLYFLYAPVTMLFCIIAFLLLCYPDISVIGVGNGINICLNSVLPSLFPFLFLSSVIINLGVFKKVPECLNKVSYFLFKLPGVCLIIIAMSMFGGFPVGAVLIKQAYEKGEITALQGRRMLLFCINPGPAFVISTVGYLTLGSKKAGVILYISGVITSLILGILSRFFESEDDCENKIADKSCAVSVSQAIVNAVNSSVQSILNICAWIIFFSCTEQLIDITALSENIKDLFKITSEVTIGCAIASNRFPLPIVCAVIGFSGFCIHLQVMPAIIKLKLKLKYFYVFRLLAAALNCVISMVILERFPVISQVISLGEKPAVTENSSSLAVCIGLMFMCGLFVLKDSYILCRKKENRQYY